METPILITLMLCIALFGFLVVALGILRDFTSSVNRTIHIIGQSVRRIQEEMHESSTRHHEAEMKALGNQLEIIKKKHEETMTALNLSIRKERTTRDEKMKTETVEQ